MAKKWFWQKVKTKPGSKKKKGNRQIAGSVGGGEGRDKGIGQ